MLDEHLFARTEHNFFFKNIPKAFKKAFKPFSNTVVPPNSRLIGSEKNPGIRKFGN